MRAPIPPWRYILRRSAAVAGSLLLVSMAAAGTAAASPSSSGVTHRHVHVCSAATSGSASCNAIRSETLRNGKPVSPHASSPSASAKTPANIQNAYGLGGGAGQLVAIVDAYDDPT